MGPVLVIASLFVSWRAPVFLLGAGLFGVAVLVTTLNVYLSLIRVPLLRALGRPPEEIRHVSGIPLVGMCVVPATYLLPQSLGLSLVALVLLALDTGNLIWFTIAVWRDESFFKAGN